MKYYLIVNKPSLKFIELEAENIDQAKSYVVDYFKFNKNLNIENKEMAILESREKIEKIHIIDQIWIDGLCHKIY